MSLDNSVSPDNSATPTNTTDEVRARDPKDTGPIDAEVISETKRPAAAPRVARVADVRKLDADDVFGGAVSDTENVKRARGEAPPPTGKNAKKGKKKVDAPPAEPPTEKRLEEARGLLMMADMIFVGWARSTLSDDLEAASLDELAKRMSARPEQLDAMAPPLAEGLAEEGVELPWYMRLALAGGAVYGPKVLLIMQVKQQAEKAKGGGA